MRLAAVLLCLLTLAPCMAQETVRFATDDGGSIVADLYPGGRRAVILAHGGRFNRQSWKPQAELLQQAGYRVLAPDFRGFGESTGPGSENPLAAPLHLDLIAAARYLRSQGAEFIAIVGGSMGGMAAGDAVMNSKPGEIQRVVFLSAPASLSDGDLSRITGRKLFITARDDLYGSGNPRLVKIQADYESLPPPRELLVVDGAAHAQALFDSEQSAQVLNTILRFLGEG
jgi:pimeloyl-ACP methyl ester carboxylesterase